MKEIKWSKYITMFLLYNFFLQVLYIFLTFPHSFFSTGMRKVMSVHVKEVKDSG